MRTRIACLAALVFPALLSAQGKWPPDSLVNVHVIPKTTSVIQVTGMMRNFTFALGVRCQFCHIGEEGQPLDRFDFVKDEKRTKLIARQMMRMTAEINRRLDTIAQRGTPPITVTCTTCHRGISRP